MEEKKWKHSNVIAQGRAQIIQVALHEAEERQPCLLVTSPQHHLSLVGALTNVGTATRRAPPAFERKCNEPARADMPSQTQPI